MSRYAPLCFLWLALSPAYAPAQQASPDIPLQNPAQEAQARAMFYELRCEVCEGQTIGDSAAPLAADMRALVRQKIAAGEDESSIRRFFAEKYGDAILMRPPLTLHTLPLWWLPLVLLALGATFFARYFIRAKAQHHGK